MRVILVACAACALVLLVCALVFASRPSPLDHIDAARASVTDRSKPDYGPQGAEELPRRTFTSARHRRQAELKALRYTASQASKHQGIEAREKAITDSLQVGASKFGIDTHKFNVAKRQTEAIEKCTSKGLSRDLCASAVERAARRAAYAAVPQSLGSMPVSSTPPAVTRAPVCGASVCTQMCSLTEEGLARKRCISICCRRSVALTGRSDDLALGGGT